MPPTRFLEEYLDLVAAIETAAARLDTDGQTVTLDDGTAVAYDELVIATGLVPRRIPALPDLEGIRVLRSLDESLALREHASAARHAVIVGAGFIGCEVAASLRSVGVDVVLVEPQPQPLAAVLGEQIGELVARLHRDEGVDVRLGVGVTEVRGEGHVDTVVLTDGTELPADAVVVGVGVAPDVALAEAAGLAVDNGVPVDASLRTSDPDVYAVGDIANQDHPVLGHRVRVEHWATALNQPATAAAAMLGQDASYTELPYFFSDQYDLGMEYIGYAPKDSYAEVVVRGDLAAREFVAFWLGADSRVKAAMNVNVWDVVDEVKPIIATGKVVSKERLADPGVPYSDL